MFNAQATFRARALRFFSTGYRKEAPCIINSAKGCTASAKGIPMKEETLRKDPPGRTGLASRPLSLVPFPSRPAAPLVRVRPWLTVIDLANNSGHAARERFA